MLRDLIRDVASDATGSGAAPFSEEGDAAAALTVLEDAAAEPAESEDEPEEPEEPEESEEEVEEPEEPEEKEGAKKVTPITHHRPSVKDVTSKYPQFFKEFPDMKNMMFREQAYEEVFPTVDDAKQAAEDADSFSTFRNLITSGEQKDFQEFIGGVNQEEGALTSMAAHFLPSLYNVNRDLYFQTTQPIAVSLLRNAFKTGANGNENLQNAALVLAQWAFGDQGFATGEKTPEPIQPAKPADDGGRQAVMTERFNNTSTYVSDNGTNRLKAEITRSFDPNNAFPEYTRNLLINQVMEEVGNALQADKRHMNLINSMWKKAHQAGFAGDWKDRILSTYLSGARAIMPAIRARVRNAALTDAQKTSETRESRANKSGERKEVRGSAVSNGRGPSRTASAKEIDWDRTSDMDFLEDRVTLRK